MPLTKEEQSILLQLARNTINAFLAGKPLDNARGKLLPPLPKAIGALGERSGAFVTLHKRGMLRGCIGSMIGHGPLVHIVQEMAIAAATQDPRFSSVSPSEMGEIDIEISVLSPMKKIRDVSEIQVGVHGIMISKGFCHGVLLPQVATEQKWDRETFLIHTCYKAGLPPDAWKDPKTTIEIFSAQVFGEGRAHGRP